jgi:hypothetical protein
MRIASTMSRSLRGMVNLHNGKLQERVELSVTRDHVHIFTQLPLVPNVVF